MCTQVGARGNSQRRARRDSHSPIAAVSVVAVVSHIAHSEACRVECPAAWWWWEAVFFFQFASETFYFLAPHAPLEVLRVLGNGQATGNSRRKRVTSE